MFRLLLLANAASIHTFRWVSAIVAQGYEVHLASFEPLLDRIDGQFTFHRLPYKTNLKYFAVVPKVRRLIREIKPNLFHAHYASGYGTTAAFVNFHPTLLSIWGGDVFDFPRRSFLHRALLKFNLKQSDVLLSTSHVMARETALYTKKSIVVIPFGIDLQCFKPQSVKSLFQPHEIVIGTIKALEEWYGIQDLLTAFKLLKDRYPNKCLKLLIVGEGTQEAALKALTRQLGIEHETVFTGKIPYAEIPRYHNMLNIFVAVSIRESFGVAAIEASACGKPVVVSDVDGLPEVVEDGVTGLLVPPRDPVSTANAIEQLIAAPELRAHMGAAGIERVRRLYNWETNVVMMMQIYQSVLSN